MNSYETDLNRNPANYVPLTPITFLERAATVYPDHPAVIDGDRCYTWSQTYARCRRLASALARRGIKNGDTVAVIAPNIPAIYEASFGIAMVGAVVNTINIRLDPATIGFILEHGEAKAVLVDTAFVDVLHTALSDSKAKPYIIDIADPAVAPNRSIGTIEYEDFLLTGDPSYAWHKPNDEWCTIALNYTSGTTGSPKGVIYHHRGAYLNAIGNVLAWDLAHHPVYLWTLPMFHCNGWCFPWTLAAVAGTSVCLRKVEAGAIYDAITTTDVTHLCGAPVVLNMILQATAAEYRRLSHRVKIMTAAAPPPAAVLEAIALKGFDVTHVYGLTETYGPAAMCAWKTPWNTLPMDQQAVLKSRQGVRYHVLDEINVIDPATMNPVPHDGQTIGEVMFRGNIIMKGYLKNPAATAAAFKDGWFHSGDLAVMHDDGYLQLKDRSKDIIISGGENISSIEIEDALYRHPDILDVAVVAQPDAHWGEVPCAFVDLKPTPKPPSEQDLIDSCRQYLASYKIPRRIVFGALPKTSTGKIQKFILRKQILNGDHLE